ncbi:MAG: hypothetical protein WBA61_10635 [Aequorivita sp.]
MSTGITKPNWHELQNDLTAIAEIPERVEGISVVRLKEILIYTDNEIKNRISDANEKVTANFGKYPYPKEYLPNQELDYWLNSIHQFGLNYYHLKDLQSYIVNYLNSETTFNNAIFKDAPSQRFFEFLFYNFISKDQYPKTAVEYVFRQFFDTGKGIDLIEMDFNISGTMLEFANYYNSFIINKVPKEKLKEFEIKINNKDPQIKELYRIGHRDKRKKTFNSLLLEFTRKNITVG